MVVFLGERRSAGHRCVLAGVVPPRHGDAQEVEGEEDVQRCLGAAGQADRGAVALGDEEAAVGRHGGGEAEGGGAFGVAFLGGAGHGGRVAAVDAGQGLGQEDHGDHPEGRAVADAGGHEQHQEGEEEAGDEMGMGDDGEDHHDDVGGDEELEDRVMDLEDKLDELMAEFEELMNDKEGNGDDFGADEGGDAIEVDDTEEMMPMAEAVSLKAAPKPVTSEEGSVNKKSTVAANSGAAGMAAKPVHTGASMGGKHDAAGAYSNQTKDLIGDFQNKAGSSMKDLSAATKPHLAQATGVNTKSPLPGGRKG